MQPEIGAIDGAGRARVDFTQTIALEAARSGNAKDGRTYTIEVTVRDRACNARTASTTVTVPHDQRQ